MSNITAERETEYGVPYGKYAVNADMNYINSERFAKKFKDVTESETVNKVLLECAVKAITHRSGTLYEDMYLINGITGEIMAEQLDSECEKGIFYNESIKAAIVKARAENIPLVALHSHPEGYPPSIDDFNKAYTNGYSVGVIAGHNGQVYTYSNEIGFFEYADDVQTNIASAFERGYDVDRAFRETYDEIGFSYHIVKE